jgi:predicted O-methyltransferase YrrM
MSTMAEYMARLTGPWCDIQDHLGFLYDTVRSRQDPVVVEFGVRRGNSTAAFLAALEGTSGHLWSGDVAMPEVPVEWFKNPHWTFLPGNDIDLRFKMPQEIDVLFIDTNHDYRHTLAELRTYVPRLAKGGVALLHDTQWDEGDAYLATPTGPVAQALDYFCQEAPYEWTNRGSKPGGYGLGLLYR